MNALIHPALWQLAGMRMRGRIRSMVSSFMQPRKFFVSLLGAILAVVWLSNVIASILFRERYESEALRSWMTLMLTMYAGWHFVRVAWQRPESSIEWSEAENNNLIPSPLTRVQLVQYRLATVLGVTTLKASIGTILLLPDLQVPWLGFCALWFGLAFVEFIRLISDTLAAGMSMQSYRSFRAVIVFLVTTLGLSLSVAALERTQAVDPNSQVPIVIHFGQYLLESVQLSIHSIAGAVITAPFALFVELMVTSEVSAETGLLMGAGCSVIIVALWVYFRLDRWSEAAIRHRQKAVSGVIISRSAEAANLLEKLSLPKAFKAVRGGAVVWRQLIGMSRYRTGVVLALIPPAILAAMPLFMERLSDRMAIVNFLGGLVFYSFLLLPSAMKFDFRRDYSHLMLLKMLPLSPGRIVCGQMIAPILVTTAFQYVMIALACVVRSMSPAVLIAALLSFPAMNFAVYGWENLMFLIFPQKLKQEGVEVFLRTTVIFTAKGVTLAVVFALVFVWAMVSGKIAANIKAFMPLFADHRLVFGVGVWAAVTVVGVLMTLLAARQFKNLDAFPDSQSS